MNREHATRTLCNPLLKVYGYNPYLNPQFQNQWREQWMSTMAMYLGVTEQESEHHMCLLRGVSGTPTPIHSLAALEQNVIHYLTNSEHSGPWSDLQELIIALTSNEHTKRLVTSIYNKAKTKFHSIHIDGGVDYFSVYNSLFSKRAPYLKLVSNRVTAAQSKQCKTLSVADPVLYQLLSNYRSAYQTALTDFQDQALQIDPSVYDMFCSNERDLDEFPVPARNGRYNKVWSRLTDRERLERKFECIFFYLATHRRGPEEAQPLITRIDSMTTGTYWAKCWDQNKGLLEPTNTATWHSQPNVIDDHQTAAAVSGAQSTPPQPDQTNKNQELHCVMSIVCSILAERISYTREEVFTKVEKQHCLPISRATQTIVKRAINKLLLME